MKIGAVPVPINALSTPEQVAYYVNDSRAAAVVVDEDLLPRLGLDSNDFRYLKQVFVVTDELTASPLVGERVLSYAEAFAGASDVLEAEPTHRDDPSYWLYTSGTEGDPKGTVHLQRDMVYCTGTWIENVSQPGPDDIYYSAS